jgi:dipeptide/tripeptide permease
MHLVSAGLLLAGSCGSWASAAPRKSVEQDDGRCIFIILACLAFFALYEQTYGSWVAFSDRHDHQGACFGFSSPPAR